MANTVIQLKHSTLTGNVPSSLANGEISINNRDGKFFYSTPAGIVTTHYPYLGPAGLNKEIQFNDNGTLGSDAGLAFDKVSGSLNVSNAIIVNGRNLDAYANAAFLQANTPSYTANSAASYANSAFAAANSGSGSSSAGPYANAAFATANSKTQTYFQNNAPSTPNANDLWIANTGVMYENFGNTTYPVWAEVGASGFIENTTPGSIVGTTITASNTVNITYTPATTIGNALQITAANTQGGTGYADVIKLTNISGGATNPNKTFRLSSIGGLEIINSAYNTALLTLSDAGVLNISGQYQVAGKQAVNGPAFRAYIAGSQTITSGSQQKVTFGSETFDTNSNFASSTFTPTVEGYYQLNATVRISGSSGLGEIMLTIWKNGSEYARGTNEQGTEQGNNFYSMQVSDLAYANGSTDYFEIYIQQTTGGNRDTTAGTNISYFSGVMVRGA